MNSDADIAAHPSIGANVNSRKSSLLSLISLPVSGGWSLLTC